MRCCIRPTRPFTAPEREALQGWVTELKTARPGLDSFIECRGETLIVRADETLAHDLALAVMMIIGRPFHYRVISVGQRNASPTLAETSGPTGVWNPAGQPAIEQAQ